MMEYDKDNMSAKLVNEITPFRTNPDFDPTSVKKGSVAAAGIAQWVHAMIIYDKVAKEVGPKKEQLAGAQAEQAGGAQGGHRPCGETRVRLRELGSEATGPRVQV